MEMCDKSQLRESYNINVAIPWSLSHYIYLGGFRGELNDLILSCPDAYELFAYDNIKLASSARANSSFVKSVARELQNWTFPSKSLERMNLRNVEHLKLNMILTERLDGDFELHHTFPFPTLSRPFVFILTSYLLDEISKYLLPNPTNTYFIKKYLVEVLGHDMCIGLVAINKQAAIDLMVLTESKKIQEKISIANTDSFPPNNLTVNSEWFWSYINKQTSKVKCGLDSNKSLDRNFIDEADWNRIINSDQTPIIKFDLGEIQGLELSGNSILSKNISQTEYLTLSPLSHCVANSSYRYIFERDFNSHGDWLLLSFLILKKDNFSLYLLKILEKLKSNNRIYRNLAKILRKLLSSQF